MTYDVMKVDALAIGMLSQDKPFICVSSKHTIAIYFGTAYWIVFERYEISHVYFNYICFVPSQGVAESLVPPESKENINFLKKLW